MNETRIKQVIILGMVAVGIVLAIYGMIQDGNPLHTWVDGCHA